MKNTMTAINNVKQTLEDHHLTYHMSPENMESQYKSIRQEINEYKETIHDLKKENKELKSKIEAITDEVIENEKWKYGMLQDGFVEGAKWVKQQLLKNNRYENLDS